MKKDKYPKEKYPLWVVAERAKLKLACTKIEAVVDLIEAVEIPSLPYIAKKELIKSINILKSVYETN